MAVYQGQAMNKSAAETMEVTFKDDRHNGGVVRINRTDYDPELHTPEAPEEKVEEAAKLPLEELKARAFAAFPDLDPDTDFKQNGVPLVESMDARVEGHEFSAAEIEELWGEFKAQE